MKIPNYYSVKNLQPLPYESKGFAQNLEYGIIKVLTENIKEKNYSFFEVGFSNGMQNMSRDLFTKGWNGIGVDLFDEPDPTCGITDKVTYVKSKVTPNNIISLLGKLPKDFDFLSLDIDSFDYEIASKILQSGYKPKTACCEFNPKFGPYAIASFPYETNAKIYKKYGYYGCSLAKYKQLFESYGYKYFGFDCTFTNIFFYDPDAVYNLDHFKINQPTDLPFTDDKILKRMVELHPYWKNINNIWN